MFSVQAVVTKTVALNSDVVEMAIKLVIAKFALLANIVVHLLMGKGLH